MAQSIDDVAKELHNVGGIQEARTRQGECREPNKGHVWVDLKTNVSPTPAYCTRCYLVSVGGSEFWPVSAAIVPSDGPLAEWI